MRLAAALAATEAPPIMAAQDWLRDVIHPPGRPLINVSQAAPVAPPPQALRAAMAAAILEEDAAHFYGPVLGMPELRAEVAAQFGAAYGGRVAPQAVAITAGCNQAFAAVMASLAGPGDAVILPVPWYFNHKMWLDMAGVRTVPLPVGPGLLPDPERAASLVTPATRAIVLVSPNNPAGVEYPAALVAAFRDLARSRGLALVLDETYRDFDSREAAPHDLLTDPDWSDTVIQLYSFSKAYRLTGHRVGAVVADPGRLAQVEKFLDTVTICAPQIGQRAALWGMRHLGEWLRGERAEILARRAALVAGAERLAPMGWRLEGIGAFFAWMRTPFAVSSDLLAPRLVREAGILALPGTMFAPPGQGGDALRLAFANIDSAGIGVLTERLAAFKG